MPMLRAWISAYLYFRVAFTLDPVMPALGCFFGPVFAPAFLAPFLAIQGLPCLPASVPCPCCAFCVLLQAGCSAPAWHCNLALPLGSSSGSLPLNFLDFSVSAWLSVTLEYVDLILGTLSALL